MADFSHTVLIKADAKMLFQFLTEVEMLPEIVPAVHDVHLHTDPPFGVGTSWTELPRRFFGFIPVPGRRTFTVTVYDKTKRRLVLVSEGTTFAYEAKKGGTRSCNLNLQISNDDPKRLARDERRYGDRAALLLAFVDD